MKEMVYTNERKIEVLERNFYKGYEYLIVNYGTHPCCYVALESKHPYYGVFYDNININCHGGLTYSNLGLINSFTRTTYLSDDYWVVGWDYHHVGDFSGFYSDKENIALFLNPKKWTTLELIEECKEFIEQLDFLVHPERLYA